MAVVTLTEATSRSTIPGRILGLALKSARLRAGLSAKVAAERTAQSVNSVWRIESGEVAAQPGKVMLLCEVYNLPEHTRDALVGLAKEGRSRGWWHSYGDMIPTWFEVYMTLERTASRIRVFEPMIIPGLLQHSDYMELVIRTDSTLRDDEVDARKELRKSRQQLLTRSVPEPPAVDVIISEAALLVEPNEIDAMRMQIYYLLQVDQLPSVTVRILPIQAGPHRAFVAGAWTLLDFPSENGSTPPPSTVYSENLTGALYLDKPSEVDTYNDIWASLIDSTLSHTQTVATLAQRLKELTDGA